MTPIAPTEQGQNWPSGDYTIVAFLHVDDDCVSNAFGHPLVSGDEAGLSPWIGAGGILPSGEMVEAVKYHLARNDFELRIDAQAPRQKVLTEFVREAGISSDAIEEVWPESR